MANHETGTQFTSDLRANFSYPSASQINAIAPESHVAFTAGISDSELKIKLEKNKKSRNFWQWQADNFRTIQEFWKAATSKEQMLTTKEGWKQARNGRLSAELRTTATEYKLVESKADVGLARVSAQNKSDQLIVALKDQELTRKELIMGLQLHQFKVAERAEELKVETQIAQMQNRVANFIAIPTKLPDVVRSINGSVDNAKTHTNL